MSPIAIIPGNGGVWIWNSGTAVSLWIPARVLFQANNPRAASEALSVAGKALVRVSP